MDFFEKAEGTGIVPVVVIEDAANAVATAKALLDGGIDFMEITMRTSCAVEAIRLVHEQVPGMHVGAGTVLNADAAQKAVEAGAGFIVSPGYDEGVVDYCIANSIPVIPGCVTPTEVMAAINKGLKVIKFFPAQTYGGIKAVKELAGVFRMVKFLPTGGIKADNLSDYVKEPCIAAVGGSWLCTSKMIAEGRFDEITELSKQARKIIDDTKESI